MSIAYQLRLFKEIFFPRHCAVCNAVIDTGLVCSSCRSNFLLQKSVVYGADRCSWTAAVRMGQPLEKEDVLDCVLLLYRYDGAFKDSLHALKFSGDGDLLPLLQEEAELALRDVEGNCSLKAQRLQSGQGEAYVCWQAFSSAMTLINKHYDLITCIPTSEERCRQRGFDVPSRIFASLAECSRACYTDKLLVRKKSTQPLFSLDAEERKEELAGCFVLYPQASVKGRRVLLCDDIFTTGSTMREAAQLLLQAGAKSVGALALCASKDNWD